MSGRGSFGGPRVCVLADAPGWAWERKARAYTRYLSDEFSIHMAYYSTVGAVDLSQVDLLHCFEVKSLDLVPPSYTGALVAGLTAHVWQTWGEERMRGWVGRCHALHGNSLFLARELQPFHPRVGYLPNGVDPAFWRRARPRQSPFTVGHVGKPTPRKGAALILEACQRVGVPCRLVQRTAHIRLPPEELREWYQDIWLQATCSDIDGTPNPMLESAACANALLSNPIGNMPEVLRSSVASGGLGPPREGRLIPGPLPGAKYRASIPWWDDPSVRGGIVQALEEQIAWAARHPASVVEMGVQARATIQAEWAWERQVEHVRQFWRQVLERAGEERQEVRGSGQEKEQEEPQTSAGPASPLDEEGAHSRDPLSDQPSSVRRLGASVGPERGVFGG